MASQPRGFPARRWRGGRSAGLSPEPWVGAPCFRRRSGFSFRLRLALRPGRFTRAAQVSASSAGTGGAVELTHPGSHRPGSASEEQLGPRRAGAPERPRMTAPLDAVRAPGRSAAWVNEGHPGSRSRIPLDRSPPPHRCLAETPSPCGGDEGRMRGWRRGGRSQSKNSFSSPPVLSSRPERSGEPGQGRTTERLSRIAAMRLPG